MIGYVTVDIEGRDMDSASRHARRIADSFINDLDNMTRHSRNADRRAMSHFETSSYTPYSTIEVEEVPVKRTIRRSVVSSRLGSVPPPATYMTTSEARIGGPRIYSTLGSTLPPRAPSRMVTSNYITTTRELPSVISSTYAPRYPETIIEPIHMRRSYTPIYRSYYAGPPAGYTSRLYSAGSYNDLTSDRLRRINRKLDDDLMEYKPLDPEYFRRMRGSLSSLNDKIVQHKKLIDRYSGIDMTPTNESVLDRVATKYRELTDRNPLIEGFRSHGPSLDTSRPETEIYYKSPQTTRGYGQGLAEPTGGTTSELRGRIKRLLCRSKRDPHLYRYLPSSSSNLNYY